MLRRGGVGSWSVLWERENISLPVSMQHRVKVEKGLGCSQPGWDTLFPMPILVTDSKQERQS